MNEITTIIASISDEKLWHVRDNAQVRNFKDAQVPAELFQQVLAKIVL